MGSYMKFASNVAVLHYIITWNNFRFEGKSWMKPGNKILILSYMGEVKN